MARKSADRLDAVIGRVSARQGASPVAGGSAREGGQRTEKDGG